jgi:hypothetical protein
MKEKWKLGFQNEQQLELFDLRFEIECISCYCGFEKRLDAPNLKVCPICEPDPKCMADYRCPKCGWDSTNYDWNTENRNVVIKNRRPDWEYGYCGGENWTEVWTCPECSTVFQFENGSV